MRTVKRTMAALCAAVIMAVGFASVAQAGTRAEVAGGQLRLTGESDPNHVQVSAVVRLGVLVYRVGDTASDFPFPDGASMTPGSGCVRDPADGDFAFCNLSPVGTIVIATGADVDKVSIGPEVPDEAVINGGTSPDELDGSLHGDRIDGGDGNDQVDGQGGDDTLDGGEGDDLLLGNNDEDTLLSGVGADRYLGGDGIDTVDYTAHPIAGVSVTIDGDDNDGNAVDSRRDNVESSVESVIGTSGADFLSGSLFANTLNGRGSGDTLHGNGGRDGLIGSTGGDVLLGGADVDTAVYTDHVDRVTVTLDDTRNDGNAVDGAERDHVRFDVEAVEGGPANDSLTGGPGLNVLDGNGGDDTLDGKTGPDTLEGDVGADTVTYRFRTDPLAVSLDNEADDGSALDGPLGARDDVRSDVETLIGGDGNDTLTGNAAANTLAGQSGADTLLGEGGDDRLVGGFDADVMDGGDGTDLVSYVLHFARVVVDLDGLADDGGDSDGDGVADEGDQVMPTVENLEGSAFGDILRGSALPNELFGNGGDDRLLSGGGPDHLDGGGNLDRINAAAGDDVVAMVDGVLEVVRCGGGFDRGSADAVDRLDACEGVVPGG